MVQAVPAPAAPVLNRSALTDWMVARGLDSISALSRSSGVDRSTCSRILSGERTATPSQIVAFTEALGVSPLTLIGPERPEDAIRALAATLGPVDDEVDAA